MNEQPKVRYRDTRPMSPEKKARIDSAVRAIEEHGRISADEFLARLSKRLDERAAEGR
jgi:hypothetical protein